MDDKKRILFVDDESRVLDGIRRMLRGMRDEWETTFAGGGEEALQVMARKPFDVIVSDIRMPGISGTELLIEVKAKYPSMVRIALSGQSDIDSIFRSVGPIHQYLSKPCDPEKLKSTIARTFMLRAMLENGKLESAVSEMESLPSMPENYNRLLEELEKPEASIKVIEQVVSQDMGMSAKLLQLVNSSFFGVGRRISDPARAIIMLGLETVKRLTLMTHVFSQFNCNSIPEFKPDDLWKHSVASAGLAKRIAVLEQADEKTCDDSFIAGLLHDVGKLVLASKLNSEYRKVFEIASRDGTDLLDAERKTLGATHAEVGAYLLGLWGLSDSVVEAVAYHHSPEKCLSKQFSTLTAVHAANAISRHVSAAGDSPGLPGLSTEYIERIGKADRLQAWIESYVREHSEA